MKKYNYFLFLPIFFLISSLSAQSDWQTVLGGSVIAPPHTTSWGFISITEGNLLSACTENGKILWQKKLRDKPSTYYAVTKNDFLYSISDSKTKISLYNPSGIFLWEKELPDLACGPPLCGRDGRIFVPTKNKLLCYGLKGIRKWQIDTEIANSDFPLLELNDGSLLLILDKTQQNDSIGCRISPYGTIIEEIHFSGKIFNACSFSNGILVIFSNGTIGCLSVINNLAISAWTISANKTGPQGTIPYKIIAQKDSFCIVYTSKNNTNTYLYCYNLINLNKQWEVSLPLLKINNTTMYPAHSNRYDFYSDNYSVSFRALDGKKLWEKAINTPPNMKYCMVSQSGYLICTTTDWTVHGYRLYQDLPSLETDTEMLNDLKKTYSTFSPPVATKYPTLLDITNSFINGDYGAQELVYKKFLEKEKELVYKNFYTTNATKDIYLQTEFISAIEKSGTSDSASIIATIITKATDPVVIQHALQAAAIIGYDDDGKMLDAIELLLSTKKSYILDTTAILAVDATYSICYFMGRPIFYSKGKDILFEVLSYKNKNIEEYTIKILEKIILMKM
jgi:hypothetical protein